MRQYRAKKLLKYSCNQIERMRICGRKLNFGNLDCKEQLSKFNLFYLRGNEISG